VNALYRRLLFDSRPTGTGQIIGSNMYYVYVLLSEKDNNFYIYIGFTENVGQRFDEHNAGKNASTRSRRPFKLIYYEGHTSKSDALRREKYFKTTKGKVTLKQILKDALLDIKSKHAHLSR
jgi:putative endonuclease